MRIWNRFHATSRHARRVALLYILFFLCVVFVSVTAYAAGIRINLSRSLPIGIWRVDGTSERSQRDCYVTVSPNGNPGYELALERGYLYSNSHMLKKIVAVEGDIVSYDVVERSVTVNGDHVFRTEILSQDTEGRPLPAAHYPVSLTERQVWLSSENIRGYDSRYFGPVSSDLLRKATPIWIFH
jgi:conjugative transfer signal peptidase TraF